MTSACIPPAGSAVQVLAPTTSSVFGALTSSQSLRVDAVGHSGRVNPAERAGPRTPVDLGRGVARPARAGAGGPGYML